MVDDLPSSAGPARASESTMGCVVPGHREIDPQIVVPRWRQLDSGLFVPSSVADRIAMPVQGVELPRELQMPVAPVAIVDRLPTSADQMVGAINEDELGLPRSSLDELIEWAQLLPFEPVMLLFARIASVLWHIRENAEAQAQIIEGMNMPNLLAAVQASIARDRGGTEIVVFAEQYVTALERILVEHALPRRVEQSASEAELRGAVAAYFATSTVVSSADADLQDGDPSPEEWLTYLLKNGVYNTKPSLANVLTRYHELLDVLPAEFVGHPQYCPIRDWMRDEYGLTAIEQHSVGFYSYAMTNVLDDDASIEARSLIRHPFAQSTLTDRLDRVEDLLSAPREWYQEHFAALGAGLDAIAWERRPFLQRPFLRCEDGQWILLFPRAIESWLGEGLHYRTLDAAAARGETRRYNNFFGHLVERYCLDLARSAYPLDRPIGSGRTHPEQAYGPRGGKRTFDIAIDFGTDVVAVEIVAARLTAEMQVFGHPEVLARELEKMLFKKIRQLGPPVRAVLAGDAEIPDVDCATIQRVWPVVVTAGAIMVTELLWDRIAEALPDEQRRARVEPLSVLDLDDFELLLSVGDDGRHLPDLLRDWRHGAYQHLDFTRFAHQQLHIDPALRLPIINQRWEALGERVRSVLFPDATRDQD